MYVRPIDSPSRNQEQKAQTQFSSRRSHSSGSDQDQQDQQDPTKRASSLRGATSTF